MRKVVATAVGLAAGAFAVGAALTRPEGIRRSRREDGNASKRREETSPRPDLSPRAVTRLDSSPTDEASYVASSADPFGPYHGARRPPGLPLVVVEASGSAGRVMVDGTDAAAARAQALKAFGTRFEMTPSRVRVRSVRRASARGAALRPIAENAARHGHGDAFVKTVTHLAKTEGEGGTFAVPARNFNTACLTRGLEPRRLCTPVDAPRDSKRRLVTAWGVFQWNRDAGRALKALDRLGLHAPFVPSDWMPWDWTAAEEIAIPINYYAQVWALVLSHGGSTLDAARGVRLWHTGPSRFRTYLAEGANSRAWTTIDVLVTRRIDHHLKSAGVA